MSFVATWTDFPARGLQPTFDNPVAAGYRKWEPVLTGAVGTFAGQWVQDPDTGTVHAHGLFVATAAGAGQFFFSLPVPAAPTGSFNFPIGQAITFKGASGAVYFGQVWLSTATTISIAYWDTAGAAGNFGIVAAGVPHVFAADTDIRMSLAYQGAR